MANFKIIDNFLDQAYFYKLKETIESSDFSWYYQPYVAIDNDPNDKKGFYFTHSFFDKGKINSDFFSFVEPVLEKLNVEYIIRIKANLYPNLGFYYENSNHYDYAEPHCGAILYINDNDGFTILENDTKIESIENRMLIFDSSKLHRSTHCTDKKVRLNINFNYL